MIIKAPAIVDRLPAALEEGWLKIDRVIIPVRDLDDAANSRISVGQNTIERGMNPRKAPGGLWKTRNPKKQRLILAEQFYLTVETLVSHDVSMTFISFPRFALDESYFVSKLGSYLSDRFGVTEQVVRRVHKMECKVNLIGNHSVQKNDPS